MLIRLYDISLLSAMTTWIYSALYQSSYLMIVDQWPDGIIQTVLAYNINT